MLPFKSLSSSFCAWQWCVEWSKEQVSLFSQVFILWGAHLFCFLKEFNERAGLGIGLTKFNDLWDKCNETLHKMKNTGVHNHRSSQDIYAAKVIPKKSINEKRQRYKLLV